MNVLVSYTVAFRRVTFGWYWTIFFMRVSFLKCGWHSFDVGELAYMHQNFLKLWDFFGLINSAFFTDSSYEIALVEANYSWKDETGYAKPNLAWY